MYRRLKATLPLCGYRHTIGEISLEETRHEIYSLALPKGKEEQSVEKFKKIVGPVPNNVGQSSINKNGTIRVVKNATDQFFMICTHELLTIEETIKSLTDSFYITEQSDAWVKLEITGPNIQHGLERICPLNLNPDYFPVNYAQRTLMEHLGVLIIKVNDSCFLLLSPSSSAKFFLESIKTSFEYIA